MEEREPGFCIKNGYPKPEFTPSVEASWGLAFEDELTRIVEQEIGEEIVDREKLFISDDYDFITCHIDGRTKISNIINENKTTSSFVFREKWGDPGTNMIPQDYAIQIQHQLLCTGLEKAYVHVLVFPLQQSQMEESTPIQNVDTRKWIDVLHGMGCIHCYKIERHEPSIKELIDEYEHFWNECVLTGAPPEPTNYSDLKLLFREPKGTILSTEWFENTSREYKQISGEMSELKESKEVLKLKMIDWMRRGSEKENLVIDPDTKTKVIVRNHEGTKLHSYNGKSFR